MDDLFEHLLLSRRNNNARLRDLARTISESADEQFAILKVEDAELEAALVMIREKKEGGEP